MAKMEQQYMSVSQLGLIGSVLQGVFATEGGMSEGDYRTFKTLASGVYMMSGGGQSVVFDGVTGKYFTTIQGWSMINFNVRVKVNPFKKGDTFVVALDLPEYVKGTKVIGMNLSIPNCDMPPTTEGSGSTQFYLDKECTDPLVETQELSGWQTSIPNTGPIYTKMVAVDDSVQDIDPYGNPLPYPMGYFNCTYTPHGNPDIWS